MNTLEPFSVHCKILFSLQQEQRERQAEQKKREEAENKNSELKLLLEGERAGNLNLRTFFPGLQREQISVAQKSQKSQKKFFFFPMRSVFKFPHKKQLLEICPSSVS